MTERTSKSNRSLGRAGESVACDFLKNKGFSITRKNYTVKGGEIDIIAEDEKYILFVEVKTRTLGHSIEKYGRPALAVDQNKQKHFIFAAKSYLRSFPSQKKPRLDVIEILVEEFDECVACSVSHYPGAFSDKRPTYK